MRVPNGYLSKREQQIMEILYKHDRLTANDILEKMPVNVHNSTIRTQLRILEAKGHVGHDVDHGKFVFYPLHDREEAARTALRSVVENLYKGSIGKAAAALLSTKDVSLSQEEISEIESLIAKAKK